MRVNLNIWKAWLVGWHPLSEHHAETDLNWVSPGAWNEIGSVPTRCGDQYSPENNGGFEVVEGDADYCFRTTDDVEDLLPSEADAGNLDVMGRGFEINLDEDVSGIVADQTDGSVSLYLDVQTVAGASENTFEIWAGPPHAHYGLSSNINDRNQQRVNEPDQYSAEGVVITAQDVLPSTL